MTTMKICNYVVACIVIILALCIAYVSYGYGIEMTEFGPQAGFWPFIIAITMIIVSSLIIFDTTKNKEKYQEIKISFTKVENISSYKMMLTVLIYIILINLLGFYIATFLFLIFSMYILNLRPFTFIISISLGFIACIYVIFSLLLHIMLPISIFLE